VNESPPLSGLELTRRDYDALWALLRERLSAGEVVTDRPVERK
jgi:hypothetical protein